MSRKTRRSYSGGASSFIKKGQHSAKSDGAIRLRSGSAGHKSLDNDEEDHSAIEFSAKKQLTINPSDIKIIETSPSGADITNGIIPEEENLDNIGLTFDDNDDERGGWGNKLDFLFSCISVSVGLGNVWRFPYLCYKNGGGTFLIIYFIAMFACGIPVFFQEVAAGQYLRSGGATMTGQFVPIMKGVGYATMTIVFFLDIYYCIIIAWTLFYLLATFLSIPDLPWGTCGNYWNSDKCFDAEHSNDTIDHEHLGRNDTKSPVEEYWNNRVLQLTTSISDMGTPQWELFGCLLLGWLIVYGIIWKGLHSSGKIIWFTALFPYVVMSILFFRSITLPGAWIGIVRYITPDWSKFVHSSTWIDSATQIFFAYSIGTGALPALGSYNKFHHNCVRDAIITCIVNTGTCLFAGVVTFSILGHMAYNQGTTIEKVVSQGPGLVFITYPEVCLKLPGGPIWAITFFFMLVTIGIDSEFCIVESLVTGIVDMFPNYLRPRRRQFTTFVCILLFCLGAPMTMQGGAFIFQLMDFYSASGITILWCCFFQTIAIGWIFGAEKFACCVELMTGYKPNQYWTWTWSIVAPLVMATIFIFYCVSWKPLAYGDVPYPMWAHSLGFCMSLASMLWVPIYAIYYILTQKGSIKDRLIKGITPDIKTRSVRNIIKNNSDIPMSESSARLLKNASFLTNNTNSFNIENP